MRRFLTMTLALVLALTACGGGDGGAYTTDQVEAMAPAFSEELEEVDADTAFALYRLADYGLAREDLRECAVLRSAGATCEEGAVLVLSGEDQAKTAEGALKDYVQSQIDANADYRPAEIPKLEAALVDRRGATVLLAVAGDLDAARKAVGLK